MGSNLVIVAIPEEGDRIWKISSEKVPHLTLLHLGDVDRVSNLDQIMLFVEHAANTSLRTFWLPVERRGELGEAKADVLFFRKGRYDMKAVRDFRSMLLKDTNIKSAYDAAQQFETPSEVGQPGQPWIPHMTLGYPDSPAKPIPDDHVSIYDVNFDRIAVWDGDFSGPEFRLKDHWEEFDEMDVPLDVAMSSITHYGVKGMKWGVRKEDQPKEQNRGWLDPEKHDLTSDVFKAVVWPLIPPLGIFAIPADIRLARAGGRAAKAKGEQVSNQRFEKAARSHKGFVEIHNGAHEEANKSIAAINKKYPDLSTPAKKKKYNDEITKAMQDAYRNSANRIGNRRGDRHIDLDFKNDGLDFEVHVREGAPKPPLKRVEHSSVVNDDGTITLKGRFEASPEGYIVGMEFDDFEKQTAEHTVDLGMAFLQHYGVKGMKWGVRKPPPSPVAPTATSRVPHGNKRKTKIETEGGENHDAAPDAIVVAKHRAKLAKSGPAALSNAELREVATRLQLETQVKQLSRPGSQKFVTNILRNEGQQVVGYGIREGRKKALGF